MEDPYTADPPHPVLVYDRVRANRRNTWLLMAVFVAALLPLAGGIAMYVSVARTWSRYGAVGLLTTQPSASEYLGQIMASAVALALMACAVCMVNLSDMCTRFLLRHMGAGSVTREQEPDLWRLVENLCIGAGLPQPRLYLLESAAPNAFAIGADPDHAALVVTRGLLALLDRRELASVIAHELSHIGNHDTRLGAILAALVGTLRLPLKSTVFAFEWVTDSSREGGAGLAPFALAILILAVVAPIFPAATPQSPWWRILAVTAIPYTLFGGPVLGMFLRGSVSREREFLADAGATLLTLDPEGLALALAKVGAAARMPVGAGAATAHLYFIDPLPPGTRWWDTMFPSHPAIIERIHLLAQMGDGIPTAALERAVEAGSRHDDRPCLTDLGIRSAFDEHTEPGAAFSLTSPLTMLYEAPDGSSAVLAELDKAAVVTFLRMEKNFVQVQTTDGTVGYIVQSTQVERFTTGQGPASAVTVHKKLSGQRSAPTFSAETLPGTQFSLSNPTTSLYERPDGWSMVVEQLPAGSVVTFNQLEENFARVVAGRAAGYIPRSAAATLLVAQRQDRIDPAGAPGGNQSRHR